MERFNDFWCKIGIFEDLDLGVYSGGGCTKAWGCM
jgi:hypothetical protein